MSARRLSAGGDIDRSRRITFRFAGRQLTGFAGDTLASALMANGVRVVGRSFKYHRPRGLFGAGVEESNAIVDVGEGGSAQVNLRATEVLLTEGLVAKPVNCWPSPDFDVGAVNNLVNRFIPAGFYYKTFIWPDWHLFEPFIRKAAGLGRPSRIPDTRRYEERHAHCDVLVVGSGAAGLSAARAAAATGRRVLLVEQEARVGGQLRWRGGHVEGLPASDWADGCAAEIAARPEAQVLTRTTAVGYFDHNFLALVERPADGGLTRLWKVRARRVILATGAIERPLVFPGNDRPGVMLASAGHRYLGEYAVLAGRRVVIFANNNSAYSTAVAFAVAGADVTLVDARGIPPVALRASLPAGVRVVAGAQVIATHGRPALSAVSVREAGGRVRRLRAEVLLSAGGWNPTVHLFCQSGGRLDWDDDQALFAPGQSAQAEVSVGAAAGRFGLSAALQDGARAGLTAIGRTSTSKEVQAPGESLDLHPLWRVEAPGKAFVDLQNDVTVGDIKLSARENFVSVEHLKRYTTLGMAIDQGKTSNVNALALMAAETGQAIPQVGTTRYRFPYTPVEIGAFAGQARGLRFRPLRRMPAHALHEAAGAVFEEYGTWLRPAYYPRAGEAAHAAEQREALAVREAVGLFEGSPLGKIEVCGPDAGAFLDRIYANTMSTLKPGRCRYGLMLNELGVVIDDGVAARLDESRFLVGTTGGGAARIAAWLEEWHQTEWPHLDVLIAPVTTSVAVLTLSGPLARRVLESVGPDFDLSPEAFTHMSFRDGVVAGIPARVFRVSFTGEASYEINVPADTAESLWKRLTEAGAPQGLTLVGLDAWMLLRTEKGYLHIGADTDGTTTALDVGWTQVMKRKGEFIGRRSLLRPDDQRTDRPQFVGLEGVDPSIVLPIGAHLQRPGAPLGPTEGYVTSTGHSPILGRGVALGMVKGGRARHGEVLDLVTPGGRVPVRIIPPGVYDAEGGRLHA